MNCVYTYELSGQSVTLTGEQLFNRIQYELKNNPELAQLASFVLSTNPTEDVIMAAHKAGKDHWNDRTWEGVSDYLNHDHDLGLKNASGASIRSLLSPIYDKEKRIENSLTPEYIANNGGTRQAALESLTRLVEEEQIIADVGTLEHALLEAAIQERVKNLKAGTLTLGTASPKYETMLGTVKACLANSVNLKGRPVNLMKIIDNEGELTIDEVVNHLHNSVVEVERQLFTLYADKNVKFFTELEIGSELKLAKHGLKGKIDLLVLHEDGTVDIYDYKLSSRSFSDWDPSKRYHTEYQLGTYRAILAAHGIDGAKVNLFTMPIYIPTKKTGDEVFGNVANIQVEGRKSLTTSLSGGKTPHLDWKHGKFTNNLRLLIPQKTAVSAYETSVSTDDITDDFRKVLEPFESTKKSYSKEELERRIYTIATARGQQFVLNNIITGKPEYASTIEEFTKEGGIIDEMLDQAHNLLKTQVKGIAENIDSFQANPNISPESIEFLNSKDNHNAYNVLQSTFLKYCDGKRWERIDCAELMELGIFVFKDVYSQQVEVVRLSDEVLATQIDHHGTNHVLGLFLTNEEAQQLRGFKALESTAGNMKLMETLIAINKFPNIFTGCQLSAIKVINCTTGEAVPPESLHQLMDNFNFLLDKTKDSEDPIVNNFKEKKINIVEPWEMLEAELQAIIRDKKLGLVTVDDKLQDAVIEVVNNHSFTKADVDHKIKMIQKLMLALKHQYPQVQYTNMSGRRAFDHPSQILYYICSQTLTYYQGTAVTYSGKLTKWGLGAPLEQGVRLLGIPFMSNYRSVLHNGFKDTGILQGLDMSTPTASPSQSLSLLFQQVGVSMDRLRHESLSQVNYINNITLEYVDRKGSKVGRAVFGGNKIWEDLIRKDPDGKRAKDLKFIDPYKHPEEFEDPRDIEFLQEMLWEINKYLLPIPDEYRNWRYKDHKTQILALDQVIKAMDDESYFNVPLRKATDFDVFRNMGKAGFGHTIRHWWDTQREQFDPRMVDSTARQHIQKTYGDDVSKMYNSYGLGLAARNDMLANEGVYAYEIDLSILASDVAFQFHREKLFNDVLLTADAVATVMHFIQQNSTADFDEELEYLDNEIKVAIKNESLVPEELQGVMKGVNVAKKINSILTLGLRPMQMIKELTYGQFINYSRAFALKGTSNEVSAKSVFMANLYVWGKQAASWMRVATGQEDMAAFTLCQMMNQEYGIANQDSNSFIQKNTIRRTGLSQGLSKFMFIFQTCPDFFNRMSLFVAKMIEDGCFDAHYLDQNGMLKYDIKRDKRFEKLVELGWDSTSTDPEYLKQKALYRAMVDQFKREGFKNDITGNSLAYADLYLPRAYTVKQKLSMKEVSDLAYGFYDHETKSLNDHKVFGLVFKQFMAFWTAKTTLWFRGPGANTAQGEFKQMIRDGQPLYVKYTEVNGEIIQEYVTDSEGGTLEPVYEWVGDYCEGLMYSIMYTLRDVFTFKWKDIASNPYRLANLKLALHDLLIGLLLGKLLLFIFTGGSMKTNDAHPMARAMIRGIQDVGPQALIGLSITPAFVTTAERLRDTIPDLISGDLETQRAFKNMFGAVRDFTWALEQ